MKSCEIVRKESVSIQLISPASGDELLDLEGYEDMSMQMLGFHSINIPSEWGRTLLDK